MTSLIHHENAERAQAGNNRVDFVEFYVSGQSFGINILKVKQMFQYVPEEVKRLDGARPEILGSIYFRGKPILLIDLGRAMGLPPAPVTSQRRVPQLILATEFNETITGFLVDGVNKIHRESWASFRQVEGIIAQQACIIGTITVHDTVIQIVDLEELLYRISPQHLAMVHEPHEIDHKQQREQVNVVYLEDSATIRRMTLEALGKAGFQSVTVFRNGQEAANYLQQIREKITRGEKLEKLVSIVVSDIEMPLMDGLTLCRSVKQDPLLKSLPFIIYSSLSTDQIRIQSKEVGADVHLSKPKAGEIVKTIDRLLGL